MIKDFRFLGDDFTDVQDLTQPDCVPSLQTIVQRALAGVGTGLGQSIYDETDDDLNMMDRLDREAMRQDTERRISLAEQEEKKEVVDKPVAEDEVPLSASSGEDNK